MAINDSKGQENKPVEFPEDITIGNENPNIVWSKNEVGIYIRASKSLGKIAQAIEDRGKDSGLMPKIYSLEEECVD